jgi:hypothetical protein
MIVWRGRGGLIFILAFGCLVAAEWLTRSYFHDNTYYQRHGWPKLAGFLVAAGLVWLLSRPEAEIHGEISPGFESPRKEPVLRRQDTLFHIPARYWPGILCVLGVVFYFVPVSG